MKLIAALVVVAIIVAVCIIPGLHNDAAAVDTRYMVSLLTKSSELTTAKIQYTGMSEFKDTGIAFINKSDFIMVYNATARVGIDVAEVKVDADDINKVIYITIPAVEVQDVKVDAESIRYFDTKFSLFNIDQREDGNEAIALAEQEAKTEIQEMGVIQMAQDQAEMLIKGILAEAIPDDYSIVFK